jgi:hypothetical protein
MKQQVIRTLDTLKRVNAFYTNHAADFPASSLGGQQFAKVAAAVTQAGTLGEQQLTAGADAHNSVLSKATLRLLIHDDMAGINRVAHSLSLLGTADLDGKFAMPHSRGDQKLVNAARAFITEATPFKAPMTQLGLPADFLDTLKTHTDAFETAGSGQAAGTQSKASATAGLSDTAHDAVIALHVLDTIVRNTYKNDPQKLAEWTVASHVERNQTKAATPVPVPQPTPTAK